MPLVFYSAQEIFFFPSELECVACIQRDVTDMVAWYHHRNNGKQWWLSRKESFLWLGVSEASAWSSGWLHLYIYLAYIIIRYSLVYSTSHSCSVLVTAGLLWFSWFPECTHHKIKFLCDHDWLWLWVAWFTVQVTHICLCKTLESYGMSVFVCMHICMSVL